MSAVSDRTHLWLSCEPRRLDMVSSKFWRRSRTFCTVRFLWDSGSAVQPGGGEKKGCKSFRTSRSDTERGGCFMWSVLLEEAKQARIFFQNTWIPAGIICVWTDVTYARVIHLGATLMPLKRHIFRYGVMKQTVLPLQTRCILKMVNSVPFQHISIMM